MDRVFGVLNQDDKDLTIVYNVSRAVDDKVRELIDNLIKQVKMEYHELALTNKILIALSRRIVKQVDDPTQALAELGTAIDEFLSVREAAARGTNLGELVDQTLRNIAAANERGAFDEGARLGAQAFAEWEERQEAQRQAGLRLIEANIEQERLRFDAAGVARWVAERLKLAGGGTIDFDALRDERAEWYQRGLIRGLRLDTDVSIALARLSIELAPSNQAWAMAQNDLAVALSTQGARTGGAAGLALLAEAVAADRAALTVYTRRGMPADWAGTQNNLGNALRTQGQRTGGAAGLALLDEAAAAYRAALTAHTESAMPVQWAMTQNNLGAVLRSQSERIGGEAGLALLNEAVAAYRAALTVRTESAMPADWAMTQNNLGNALRTQAERTGGVEGLALLAEAVAAYRAALTVYTESAMPAQWAGTQNNLGSALRMQGARTGGAAGLVLLADAVAAYRAALTVRTESAMPAHWAATQNNLGNALSAQGERTEGAAGLALLNEAVTAYRAALTVWTAEHFGHDHEGATRNLNRALALITERSA